MDGMFFWYISLVYFCRLFPLPLAWLFDRWQGDPSWLHNPVVGFGKLIAWGENVSECGESPRLERGNDVGSIDCGSLLFYLPLF